MANLFAGLLKQAQPAINAGSNVLQDLGILRPQAVNLNDKKRVAELKTRYVTKELPKQVEKYKKTTDSTFQNINKILDNADDISESEKENLKKLAQEKQKSLLQNTQTKALQKQQTALKGTDPSKLNQLDLAKSQIQIKQKTGWKPQTRQEKAYVTNLEDSDALGLFSEGALSGIGNFTFKTVPNAITGTFDNLIGAGQAENLPKLQKKLQNPNLNPAERAQIQQAVQVIQSEAVQRPLRNQQRKDFVDPITKFFQEENEKYLGKPISEALKEKFSYKAGEFAGNEIAPLFAMGGLGLGEEIAEKSAEVLLKTGVGKAVTKYGGKGVAKNLAKGFIENAIQEQPIGIVQEAAKVGTGEQTLGQAAKAQLTRTAVAGGLGGVAEAGLPLLVKGANKGLNKIGESLAPLERANKFKKVTAQRQAVQGERIARDADIEEVQNALLDLNQRQAAESFAPTFKDKIAEKTQKQTAKEINAVIKDADKTVKQTMKEEQAVQTALEQLEKNNAKAEDLQYKQEASLGKQTVKGVNESINEAETKLAREELQARKEKINEELQARKAEIAVQTALEKLEKKNVKTEDLQYKQEAILGKQTVKGVNESINEAKTKLAREELQARKEKINEELQARKAEIIARKEKINNLKTEIKNVQAGRKKGMLGDRYTTKNLQRLQNELEGLNKAETERIALSQAKRTSPQTGQIEGGGQTSAPALQPQDKAISESSLNKVQSEKAFLFAPTKEVNLSNNSVNNLDDSNLGQNVPTGKQLETAEKTEAPKTKTETLEPQPEKTSILGNTEDVKTRKEPVSNMPPPDGVEVPKPQGLKATEKPATVFDTAKKLGIKGVRSNTKPSIIEKKIGQHFAGENAVEYIKSGKAMGMAQYENVSESAAKAFASKIHENLFFVDDRNWTFNGRGLPEAEKIFVSGGLLKPGNDRYIHEFTPAGKELAHKVLTETKKGRIAKQVQEALNPPLTKTKTETLEPQGLKATKNPTIEESQTVENPKPEKTSILGNTEDVKPKPESTGAKRVENPTIEESQTVQTDIFKDPKVKAAHKDTKAAFREALDNGSEMSNLPMKELLIRSGIEDNQIKGLLGKFDSEATFNRLTPEAKDKVVDFLAAKELRGELSPEARKSILENIDGENLARSSNSNALNEAKSDKFINDAETQQAQAAEEQAFKDLNRATTPEELEEIANRNPDAFKYDEDGKPSKFAEAYEKRELEITGSKERGLITTIKNNPNISDELKSKIAGRYEVRNTKDLFDRAISRVETEDIDELAKEIRMKSRSEGRWTDEEVATGYELARKFEAEGRIDEAAEIEEALAKKATEGGQMIQAYAKYGKTTPEGAIREANKILEKAMPKAKAQKLREATNNLMKDFNKANKKAVEDILNFCPPENFT